MIDIEHIQEGNWSEFWKMQVLYRVKNFLWRACKDVLATKRQTLPKQES